MFYLIGELSFDFYRLDRDLWWMAPSFSADLPVVAVGPRRLRMIQLLVLLVQ